MSRRIVLLPYLPKRRALIALSGPDTLRFLQSLTTADLRDDDSLPLHAAAAQATAAWRVRQQHSLAAHDADLFGNALAAPRTTGGRGVPASDGGLRFRAEAPAASAVGALFRAFAGRRQQQQRRLQQPQTPSGQTQQHKQQQTGTTGDGSAVNGSESGPVAPRRPNSQGGGGDRSQILRSERLDERTLDRTRFSFLFCAFEIRMFFFFSPFLPS
jgi:hypothetical protein